MLNTTDDHTLLLFNFMRASFKTKFLKENLHIACSMYPRNLLYLIVLSSCKKALQAGQGFFGDTFKISNQKLLAIFLGCNIKIVQSA